MEIAVPKCTDAERTEYEHQLQFARGVAAVVTARRWKGEDVDLSTVFRNDDYIMLQSELTVFDVPLKEKNVVLAQERSVLMKRLAIYETLKENGVVFDAPWFALKEEGDALMEMKSLFNGVQKGYFQFYFLKKKFNGDLEFLSRFQKGDITKEKPKSPKKKKTDPVPRGKRKVEVQVTNDKSAKKSKKTKVHELKQAEETMPDTSTDDVFEDALDYFEETQQSMERAVVETEPVHEPVPQPKEAAPHQEKVSRPEPTREPTRRTRPERRSLRMSPSPERTGKTSPAHTRTVSPLRRRQPLEEVVVDLSDEEIEEEEPTRSPPVQRQQPPAAPPPQNDNPTRYNEWDDTLSTKLYELTTALKPHLTVNELMQLFGPHSPLASDDVVAKLHHLVPIPGVLGVTAKRVLSDMK